MSNKTLLTIVLIITSFLPSVAQEDKAIFQYDSNGNIYSVVFPRTEKSIDLPNSPESFFKDILKLKPSNCFRKNDSNDRCL